MERHTVQVLQEACFGPHSDPSGSLRMPRHSPTGIYLLSGRSIGGGLECQHVGGIQSIKTLPCRLCLSSLFIHIHDWDLMTGSDLLSRNDDSYLCEQSSSEGY